MKNKILSFVYITCIYLALLCGFLSHVSASGGTSHLRAVPTDCQEALVPISEEDRFYREFATFLDLQNDFRMTSNQEELFPLYRSLHGWLLKLRVSSETVVLRTDSGIRLVLEITNVSDLAAQKNKRLAELKNLFEGGYRVIYDPIAFAEPSSRILNKKEAEFRDNLGYTPLMEIREDQSKKIRYISEDYLFPDYRRRRSSIELGAKMFMFSAQMGEDSLFHLIVNDDYGVIFNFFKDLNTFKALSQKLSKSTLSAKNLNRLKLSISSMYSQNMNIVNYLNLAKKMVLNSPEKLKFYFEDFELHEIEDLYVYFMDEHPIVYFELLEADFHLGLLGDKEREILSNYLNNYNKLKDHKEGRLLMSSDTRESLLGDLDYQRSDLIRLTIKRIDSLLKVFSKSLYTLREANSTVKGSQFGYGELFELPQLSEDLYKMFSDAETEFLN